MHTHIIRSTESLTSHFCLQPLHFVRVPGCRVSTSDATRKTVYRRSKQLSQIREAISGGESRLQLQDEIHALPKEEGPEKHFVVHVVVKG